MLPTYLCIVSFLSVVPEEGTPEFIRSLHFFCKKAAAESPTKVSQILQASIRCVQFEVGCIQQVHHQYFMFTAVHMH